MTQDQIQHYIELFIFIAYAISHVLAITGTQKWFPVWLSTLINVIAANYLKSKNKGDDQ